MKRIYFLLITWLTTISLTAQNTVLLSSAEGNAGEEVTVSISLENTDAVSAVELSIPLDDLLSYVSGSAAVGSRCQNHAVTAGVKDGNLNVMIYSLAMANISGNTGEVATFRLKLGNQPASVSLSPSNLALTDASGNQVTGYANGNSVTILCPKAQYSTMTVDFGRVAVNRTESREVTITNVGNSDLMVTGFTLSDYVTFTTEAQLPMTIAPNGSETFTIKTTPTQRGTIQKTIRVDCNSVSKLNTIALNVDAFTVNELHVGNASGVADTEVTIPLLVNNEDAISGFQFEFDLPEQLQYVDASFILSGRKTDHVVMTSLNGQKLKAVAYSGSGAAFTGNDGEIASFKVKLSGREGLTLTPSKAILTAMINGNAVDVLSDVYGGQIGINSPQIVVQNEIDFGRVSVTNVCQYGLTVGNEGTAALTINRVIFNNENLSVGESLPLTIAAGEQRTLTIVYSSVEQKNFEATMQIYSNDPNQRLKTLMVTGNRFAPNYLYFRTPDISPTENLKLYVSSDTYDPVTGLQFDVEYPYDYYEPFDGNITLDEKAIGMTVTSRQIDENTIRYFCYFLSGGEIAAGAGALLTIEFRPGVEEVPQNTYTLSVKNIKMGTSDMNDKYAGTDVESTFSTALLKGDANGDGQVDAQDASLVLQYVAKKISEVQQADVNDDGQVDAQDASLILQYVAKKISW